MFQASAQMGAIGNQQKMMATNMTMANSMKTATKVRDYNLLKMSDVTV